MRGQSDATPPSSLVILSRTPAPQSFLRAKGQPPTNQIARTGPITPSPTPGHSRGVQVITDSPSPKSGSGAGSIDQAQAPNNQRSRSTQPIPSMQRPRHLTLLYPLLAETGMLRYFKVEDGVSYRSGDGTWP